MATEEQLHANELVQGDLAQAFGEGVEVVTSEDLNGTGDLVAVRWQVELHDDMSGPIRLPSHATGPIVLTGVTLVDIPNESFERHIDWLDGLSQLGYAIDTRPSGLPVQEAQPIGPLTTDSESAS